MNSAKLLSKINKIQDLRRRGNWKKAYKEAVFCSRQHNEPEIRQLVIFSLWEWIKDQFNRNQREEAKINIKELFRLVKNPSVDCVEIQNEFPPIFRALGLNSLLPEHLRQDMNSPEIQTELVDRFLIYGEDSSDLQSDIREQAVLIRKAFEKVEAKLDDEALELLRPISFHSPLSEWRLFIRGLISYYHKNEEKADESWKRLSNSRPLSRIVVQLRNFFADNSNASSSSFVSRFFDLFHTTNDSPQSRKAEYLNHLRLFDNYIRQKKYKELVGHFQVSRSFLQKTDPQLFERVFRTIHSTLIDNAEPDIVRQFVERNIPLPFDPSGNRTFGVLATTRAHDSDKPSPRWLRSSSYYFEQFAECDIDRIESFTPKMKARAKAIVYNLLGNSLLQEALSFGLYREDFDAPPQEIISNFFDKAIANDPTYLPTYQHLQEFYRSELSQHESKQYHPKIADVYRKLIQHIPDNKEALQYLFKYYLAERNDADALPYFERLRELEPLSRETEFLKRQLQYVQLGSLMQSDQKQAETEQLFSEIEKSNLVTIEYNYDLLPLALRYIYEIISNRPSEAETVFALAEKIGLEKRLPLILAIFAEAEHFPVPMQVLQSLREEWNSAITGRCNGNIAGALGNIAYAIMSEKKVFTDSEQILEQVFDFINRSGQVRWKHEKDLYGACKLLWHLTIALRKHDFDAMFKKLVQKAIEQFPHSPYFLFFDAETFFLEPKHVQRFNKNLGLKKYQLFIERCNNFRNDPMLSNYLNTAKLRFDDIDAVSRFWSPFSDDEEWDDDDDEIDDDDDDDDEDMDEETIWPGNRANSRLDASDPSRLLEVLTPEEQIKLATDRKFTPAMKKRLINALPKEMGGLRAFFIDAFAECFEKGLPYDEIDKIMIKKVESLPLYEQMKLAETVKGLPDSDEFDDDDDDEFPFPTAYKRSHKKKKKK
ncbi:MAG: hypothetical protein LBG58_10330 [Planctomycetaceae bacterium]|jgi:hypothetical protein|nr:hypothetical protein [Planctomycetaceae bacterium]